MWWVIPRYAMQIGVGTGIGVTLKGGSLREVLAWTALTTGVSSAAGSGAFWRGAWAASNYLRIGAPLASGGSSILATGSAAGGIGLGAAVASVAAGAVIGAGAGTVIVAVAEHKGLVYEGATKDVGEMYLSFPIHPIATSVEYAGVVAPALVQQTGTFVERKKQQSLSESLMEAGVGVVLGPIWGPAYKFFRT